MYGFESFYFCFFIIYTLYAFIIYNNLQKDTDRKKLIIALFLPLFILSALRGETVGGDLKNYLPGFDDASKADSFEHLMWTTNTEPGFKILNWIISVLSPTHRMFIIVTSIISLIGPAYLIYKYSKSPLFSSLLYFSLGFYTNTFNNVRQSVALSLCLFAIPLVVERKLLKFLIIVILAATIHYSAGIFIILYPLSKCINGIKSIIISLIAGFTLFYLLRISIRRIIINSIFVRYDPETIMNDSSGGWGLLFFYCIVLILEVIMYVKKKKNLSKDELYYCNFFIVLQVLAVLLQMYATMWTSMMRATLYFYIPIIVAVPFYLNMFKKNNRVLITISAFCLSLLFMRGVYSYNSETFSNSQGVIPYVLIDITLW